MLPPLEPVSHDERHSANVYQHRAIEAVRLTDEDRQRHRVEESGELPQDVLVLPRKSRRLTVAFHGALDEASVPPRFQYLRTLEPRPESLMFISDPLLTERPDAGLAWYVGSAERPAARRAAELIRHVAQLLKAEHIVLLGHSGGGFAAAAVGFHLPNSISLMLNAQTRIVDYEPWAVERFRRIAFPDCVDNAAMQRNYAQLVDLSALYSAPSAPNHMLFALQTRGDELHWRYHWTPFARALGVAVEGGKSADGRFIFKLAEWGDTHAGPGSVAPYVDQAYALLDEQLAKVDGPRESSDERVSPRREPGSKPSLACVEVDAVVHPHIATQQACGVVPAPDIPKFAAHRRWDPSRLAPVPGVPLSEHKEDWAYGGPAEALDGSFWYFGVMDRHFGHFVTESLSRVWWHLENPNHGRRAVVVPYGTSGWDGTKVRLAELREWQSQLLAYFNIEDPLFVDRPVRIAKLAIPEQGAILFGDHHTPEFRAALAKHDERMNGPRTYDVKLFLRRPRDPNSGGLIGESAMSDMLREAGYLELSPETLAIDEQLRLVRRASHVISVEGSGLHLFNLLGDSPGAKVLSLRRLSEWSSQAFSRSVAPYVGSLTTVPTALRFASSFSSSRDLVVPDLRALQNALAHFDSTIEWHRYDFEELSFALLDDVVEAVGATTFEARPET